MRTHAQQSAALTRAVKKGPEAVITEVKRTFAEFQEHGWPDDWARWSRARDDAFWEIERETHGLWRW